MACWKLAGEQLYFLPVLFAVAFTFHSVLRICGIEGVWVLTCVFLTLGITCFVESRNTGFSWGVLIWGGACYGCGFLMMLYDRFTCFKWIAIFVLASVVLAMGGQLWPKVVPVFLLGCLPILRNLDVPLLSRVGEASGTIYIYHTPFILQPMVIGVSHFTSTTAQVLGALAAALMAIGICSLIYFGFKDTRFRWMLM